MRTGFSLATVLQTGLCAIVLALSVGKPAAAAGAKKAAKHEQGVASFYGDGFHGRPTASGERFNKRAMTAAHKKLPMGSRVRVTNLRNRKSVVLKINDRGPYKPRRIIDVSERAAQMLGFKKNGIAPVKVEILAAYGTGHRVN